MTGIRPTYPTAKLGGVVESITAGLSLSGNGAQPDKDEAGVLTLSAVSRGRFCPDAAKALPSSTSARYSTYARRDTVLISRSNTLELVGAAVYVDRDYPTRFLPDLIWELRPDRSRLDARFLAAYLTSSMGRRWIRAAASGTSGSMKKISMRRLRCIPVPLPCLSIQRDIAALDQTFVRLEVALDDLCAAKRRLRNGLAEALLPGQRRLPAFAHRAWHEVRLAHVTRECVGRNGTTHTTDRVMAVNKVHGLVPMRERTIAAEIDRYKVVPPGAFAYNPMRINIGSIARSAFKHEVLVSPDYVVFECTDCEPRYLDALRRTALWRRHMAIAGNGSVRVRIYYDDLASMKVSLPELDEQCAIADVLEAASREIDALKRLRVAVARQKRGLMQQLLTGQLRVPEVAHG